MGIFQNLGEGIRAEATVGLLLAASFFSGCARQAEPMGSKAIDSRANATAPADLFGGVSSSKVAGDRIQVQLGQKDFTRIELDHDRGYLIKVPCGSFTEIFDAMIKQKSGIATDDVFVFQVPENDISRYQVTLNSYRYCQDQPRGIVGVMDGTYLSLTDLGRGGGIESALKFPVYGKVSVVSRPESVGTQRTGKGFVYLESPDGALHLVPTLNQHMSSDDQCMSTASHKTPAQVSFINSKITPIRKVDELQSKR